METSLKSGFAQIFSCCPKNPSCPKLGGGGGGGGAAAAPLVPPPGPYAYELNDLERLVSICRGKITVERQWNILDVRSLFKELESNEWLGIDCLDTLKEILAHTEKIDLLKEVEGFEQRLSRELKFEMRHTDSVDVSFRQICCVPFFICVCIISMIIISKNV